LGLEATEFDRVRAY